LWGGLQAGDNDGIGTHAKLNTPMALSYSRDGTKVLIGDYCRLRELVLATGAVTTIAGRAEKAISDGVGTNAGFNKPYSITHSLDGTKALVADMDNHRIREVVLATRVVTTLVGQSTAGYLDGVGTDAKFWGPVGVTHSPEGTKALIADLANHRIREVVLATQVVTTVAGGASSGASDGVGTNALFNRRNRMTYSPG
jgi:DNA-binding beta-propeller fold protein YncE